MFEGNLLRDVQLKDGRQFKKGSPCSVNFGEESARVCEIHVGTESYRALIRNLPITVSGLPPPPSMEEMEEWSRDGVARSVLGEDVEPDGYDEHGSPSWLLAYGYI